MSTSRWAALSSAVLITVLTVAGALGLGPAAAMGDTSSGRSFAAIAQARHPEAQPVGDNQDAGQTEDSAADARTDDWLTIDKRQVSDSPESANPSKPVSTRLPAKSGAGKRIVFDESAQRVWLVAADDDVVRTYLVSGAKNEDLLKSGQYHVFSKSREAISFDQKETMNYMVRFTTGKNAAIGFHDIPANHNGTLAQSRDDLGTTRSAGCIRQWIADARALWEFAPVDTLVVVIP